MNIPYYSEEVFPTSFARYPLPNPSYMVHPGFGGADMSRTKTTDYTSYSGHDMYGSRFNHLQIRETHMPDVVGGLVRENYSERVYPTAFARYPIQNPYYMPPPRYDGANMFKANTFDCPSYSTYDMYGPTLGPLQIRDTHMPDIVGKPVPQIGWASQYPHDDLSIGAPALHPPGAHLVRARTDVSNEVSSFARDSYWGGISHTQPKIQPFIHTTANSDRESDEDNFGYYDIPGPTRQNQEHRRKYQANTSNNDQIHQVSRRESKRISNSKSKNVSTRTTRAISMRECDEDNLDYYDIPGPTRQNQEHRSQYEANTSNNDKTPQASRRECIRASNSKSKTSSTRTSRAISMRESDEDNLDYNDIPGPTRQNQEHRSQYQANTSNNDQTHQAFRIGWNRTSNSKSKNVSARTSRAISMRECDEDNLDYYDIPGPTRQNQEHRSQYEANTSNNDQTHQASRHESKRKSFLKLKTVSTRTTRAISMRECDDDNVDYYDIP